MEGFIAEGAAPTKRPPEAATSAAVPPMASSEPRKKVRRDACGSSLQAGQQGSCVAAKQRASVFSICTPEEHALPCC